MNIEETDFHERVAKHAALADPERLHIADLLVLGDLSPSELQTHLKISSNLLAHHLGVLEREGMIFRRRSEADRRRSYVHLKHSAFRNLGPVSVIKPHRIVFVCTANSARSQVAEALWRQSNSIPVTSAGTHPAKATDPGAVAAAHRHGLTMTETVPRLLKNVIADDDYLITVCDNAHEELGPGSALHWSVPDPARVGTDAAFDAAFENIARRIGDLAPHFSVPRTAG